MRKNRDSRRPENRNLKYGCLGDKSREASFSYYIFCYFVCTSLAFFNPLDLFNLTLKCLELIVYLYACDMNLNPKHHYLCNLNNF